MLAVDLCYILGLRHARVKRTFLKRDRDWYDGMLRILN